MYFGFGGTGGASAFASLTGATVADSAGPAPGLNPGTITGATSISGKVNGARNFSGNQYITVADNPSLDFGVGNFSFDAWIRTTTNSSDVLVIMDKRDSSFVGYEIWFYQGAVRLQMSGVNLGTSGNIATGQWVHVAITVQRATGGGVFYVDGVNVGAFNPTLGNLDNTSPLYIGRHRDGGGNFPGDLDEVELFNRALTPQEVLGIYNSGISGKCKTFSQFCNTTPISILDSQPALPYPSIITASGLGTYPSCITVDLKGFNHTFPEDVDVLLEGPGLQNVLAMSDAGANFSVSGIYDTLYDLASTPLPQSATLTSGLFKPSNYGGADTFPASAPLPPYGTTLSVFTGINPNGQWKLFVADDLAGDTGSIAGGWCVNILACNCDDGNPCTTDTCDCPSGTCTNTPNTNSCNDGNACTQTDTCQGGTCVGSNPVVCTASDQCHDVGTCNPTNGQCSNPAKANGSATPMGA